MNPTRRTFLQTAAALPAALSKAEPRSEATPSHLICEYSESPLCIDVLNPRLSWQIESRRQGERQTAYQILVATTPDVLAANGGDLWDSGKVQSRESIQIKYRGRALDSRRQCHWKVRVWDADGRPSEWSSPARWEMGLLDTADWQARWVGGAAFEDDQSTRTGPSPYFRKDFRVRGEIKRSRAYICGLGFYELYVNGARIGEDVLSPNQTDYDARNLRHLLYPFANKTSRRALYVTYDITGRLQVGANAAGFILGNGWYNQRDRVEEGWMWYGSPRAILQIEVEYADGTTELIGTDATWKTATGPLLRDAIFTGEDYDARLEMPGWDRAGFDDSSWRGASLVRRPEGRLRAQMGAPDRVIDTLTPVDVKRPKPGVAIFDMGENLSGWTRVRIQGPKGAKLTLRHIEEEGLDYEQVDTYVLGGQGVETFEPRFTWHGFRFVEVTGIVPPLARESVQGRVVHSAVASAGRFECSNPLFNKIYKNYRRTQLSNMHCGVPSDCPHRERLGYTGDGHVAAQAAIFSFDMAGFYSKWIDDIGEAQNKQSGFVTHTAPFGGGGGGPAWGSAYVLMPWYMYLYYGDRDILERHYPGMKLWVKYLGSRTGPDGIVNREEPGGWFLGDWYPPSKIEVPPELVSTCYYAHIAELVGRIARVLGKADDADALAKLSLRTRDAVNARFLDRQAMQYSIGRQGANVFPLSFGLVPKDLERGVFERLVQIVVDENKSRFDTGFVATPLLLDVLTKFGRPDIAYTLMNQTGFPSFGYMIEQGATTLWEKWDGASRMHPMFGGVCRWFYQALTGINADPDAPGFRNIMYRPHALADLEWVKAEYRSIHGVIQSSWAREEGRVRYTLKLPPNTTAQVTIPGLKPSSAGSGTHTWNVPQVSQP